MQYNLNKNEIEKLQELIADKAELISEMKRIIRCVKGNN